MLSFRSVPRSFRPLSSNSSFKSFSQFSSPSLPKTGLKTPSLRFNQIRNFSLTLEEVKKLTFVPQHSPRIQAWDLKGLAKKYSELHEEANQPPGDEKKSLAYGNICQLLKPFIEDEEKLNLPSERIELLTLFLQLMIDCRQAEKVFKRWGRTEFAAADRFIIREIKQCLPYSYDEMEATVKSMVAKYEVIDMAQFVEEILPSFETEDEKLMARACAREIFVETDPKGRIAKSN